MKAQSKQFLTDRGDEGGSIRWSISNEQREEWILSEYLNAELTVSDCYKQISLDFDCSKHSDFDKRIAKANVLIKEMTAFRNALVKAQQATKPKKFYY